MPPPPLKRGLPTHFYGSGAFQIYRAPGSVAFLRSGSALQPILPKSQAWCLDEQSSKFVLQIRRPNYWRIEVPVGNDEEIRRATLLREVLDKILQFEKTPCPFERNFTVALPERPKTPVTKRPWTPPARTVSMNWPPGQPITPPPEFPSRTRFYNPGARRFSDFGVDTSKMGLTPAASPQKSREQAQDEGEKPETPSRRARLEDSMIMCKPLLEEPEPISPLPTAIPLSIAQITNKPARHVPEAVEARPASKSAEPSASLATQETRTTQIPVRKREPIWITKKVPSSADRKAKRPAITKGKSAGPAVVTAKQPTDSGAISDRTDSEQSVSLGTEHSAPQEVHAKEDSHSEATDESEAEGGLLQGSGQLRVRRTRVAAFASRRAATAPSLRLRTSSTSTLNSAQDQQAPEPERKEPVVEPGSPTESIDSFFSMESWHSPISPPEASPTFSPRKTHPHPHENIPLNRGQLSGFTTTPTVSGWDRSSIGAVAGSGAQTPDTPFTDVFSPAVADKPDNAATEEPAEKTVSAVPIAPETLPSDTNPPDQADTDSLSTSWSSAASRTSSCSNTPIRHRAATTSVAISHRNPRALSPLPPAATLLNTNNSRLGGSPAARAIRRIPSSIFNRTCEILISPPAHLISLMLKVAARISAGEWRGFYFGMDEGGEVLDVRWDWSDEGDGGLGWEEADFGGDFRRPKTSASFAADLSPGRAPTTAAARKPVVVEYQDPWATPPSEPDLDEGGHWSQNWGVD